MRTIVIVALLCAGCACARHEGEGGSQLMQTKEFSGIVTMKGKPLTLFGQEIRVGDIAPDFRTVNGKFEPVELSQFKGRVCIISAVPSLDTGVCSAQTRRFNSEVKGLPGDVQIITISMDLPFAQKRWCGASGVKTVRTFSDYQKADFGKAYGVLIKELRLLARAVFIVDMDGIVKYAQIVPEVSKEPDYDDVLNAVRAMV